MELNNKLFKLAVGIVFLIGLMNFASAVDDLIALQGNVKQSGADLSIGNLSVLIYDAESGGNLIYSENFTDSIANGKYDIMLGDDGDNSANLSLEYGKLYYIDIEVNSQNFDYGSDGRQVFQAGTGNVSLSDLDFSDGQNITLSAGWFKGLFNWVVDILSSNYLSFNGTTLSFNETQLNQTVLNLILTSGNGTVGSYVGATAGVYNGNVTNGSYVGYKAANVICDIEYTGSHVCTAEEILNTIRTEDFTLFSGTGWIAGGPPGYTANANDCLGWTSQSNSYLGRFWDWDDGNAGGGKGWLTNCANTKKIYCCK